MDIQELVDARIRELSREHHGAVAPMHSPREVNELPRAGRRDALAEFGEIVEITLNEISSRVLEISEQVSGDYSRLEKELLQSRLDLLHSAELVIDMALSLKKQAGQLLVSNDAPGAFNERDGYGLRSPRGHSRERIGRASLYNDGVADLFRRT